MGAVLKIGGDNMNAQTYMTWCGRSLFLLPMVLAGMIFGRSVAMDGSIIFARAGGFVSARIVRSLSRCEAGAWEIKARVPNLSAAVSRGGRSKESPLFKLSSMWRCGSAFARIPQRGCPGNWRSGGLINSFPLKIYSSFIHHLVAFS
jgi:hypothetical protein